jgi:putative methyltransferase (TIGR04325 family)
MTISRSLHRAADYLSSLPGIRHLDRKFSHDQFLDNKENNLFFGVFISQDQAAESAPKGLKLGYDNQESASIPYTSAISPRDYPAMFWLLRSLNEGMRTIFDLGGHTGVKYYAFRRTMNFPDDIQWTVCDVPAVVRRGQQMAVDRAPEGNLQFTDTYAMASHHDVLFASGSLQYLPITLSDLLKDLAQMPKRIVVNTTPIHGTQSFFTLNSIGTAFCPYRIQARSEFIASVVALGYRKVDEWENLGKGMHIPGHSDHDVPAYSGFCFERTQQAAAKV